MRRFCWIFIMFMSVGMQMPAQDPVSPIKVLDQTFEKELKKHEAKADDRFLKEFLYMMFVLAILVGMIFAISWFLKHMMFSRMKQMNVTQSIKVLEQRGLTARSSVYLIEVNGKGFVVGDSLNGITRLGEVELPTREEEKVS